jgi:hypothetical protein
MSDQWSPSPAVADPSPSAAEAPAPADPDPSGVVDELAVLDELEADLAAVEQAIESLERVSVEGLVGDEAATRIAAAVSVERFGAGAAERAPGADA